MYIFFNDTATTEIYTLSLHDALPIFRPLPEFARTVLDELSRVPYGATTTYGALAARTGRPRAARAVGTVMKDRKSTRLNSSHANISYAVFCLKKKNQKHWYPHYAHVA